MLRKIGCAGLIDREKRRNRIMSFMITLLARCTVIR
jgi:hypothetical protein